MIQFNSTGLPEPAAPVLAQDEFMRSAMEQPLSPMATFFEGVQGGALESYGLGTVIRDFGNAPLADVPESQPTSLLGQAADMAVNAFPPVMAYKAYKKGFQSLTGLDQETPALDKAAYERSPYSRPNIPWEPGMTEARAASLATWNDAKQVRDFYREKRPIASFLGAFGGQALDPINYIPVGGQFLAARTGLGVIGRAALGSSVEAAVNTAVAGVATSGTRASFGDDTSWQAMVSDIAVAGLIGAGFGTIGGVLARRGGARAEAEAAVRLGTLKRTQEARIALNEAIDGLINEGEVRLSPNGLAAVDSAVLELQRISVEPGPRVGPDLDKAAARADEPLSASPVDDDILSPVTEQARQMGSPLDLVDKWRQDPEATHEQIRQIIQNIKLAERSLAQKYGVKIADIEDAPLTPAERDFLFYGKEATSVEEWRDIQRQLEPVGDLGEASDEIARQFRRLPETPDFEKMDGEQQLAAMRLQVLFGEVNRLGGDLPTIIKQAGAKYAGRFHDPDDAIFMAQEAADSLRRIFNGRPPPARAEPTLSPPAVLALTDSSSRGAPPAANGARRLEPPPVGLTEAAARVAKSEDVRALAEQHGVDPKTGDFAEQADLDQVEMEGRLTEADRATLDDAAKTFEDGDAFAKALGAAVSCII